MVSLEPLQSISGCVESDRLSFSSEFLDESNFISICPNPQAEKERETERARAARNSEFEFLSGNLTNMMTADELFREGKLLPFWQIHHAHEKLEMTSSKSENPDEVSQEIEQINKKVSRISWSLDDDPSPRPPKCTVLWKELLKLKKQRPSTLSPSTSSSSSSSSSSSQTSLPDIPLTDERKGGVRNKQKSIEKVKKGHERTRPSSIRIRPVLNMSICR